MFRIDATLRLPDTDAAGILFYGNYFKLAHEAYEAFMDDIDFGLPYVLNDAEVLLLIAHAEADYKSSIRLGDDYSITIRVVKIGGTSFELSYQFLDDDGETAATLKSIHVAVSKETGKPISLPESLKKGLSRHT
jgi:YbgC/YbaW family acyl-CoA thioester hydrolase